MKRKSKGEFMDFLAAGMVIIAIVIVVFAALYSMELMAKKLQISQIARKYILVMETQGCLEEKERDKLLAELTEMGMTNIDISGTSLNPVDYGEEIMLCICGYVQGYLLTGDENKMLGFGAKDFYVEEKRMSTAKN